MATLTHTKTLRQHKRMSFLKWSRMLGWRHLVALGAISFALFPFLWMASAAFDNENRISNQTLIPAHVGLNNFHALFNNPNYPYLSWIKNSIFISTLTAFLQLVVATTAAYALSRFRYKGRKLTLMTILVVQMFPQLLAFENQSLDDGNHLYVSFARRGDIRHGHDCAYQIFIRDILRR